LIIDKNVLDYYKITFDELLFLYYLFSGDKLSPNVDSLTEENLKTLEDKKLIKITTNNITLREAGKELIEFYTISADLQFEKKKKTIKISDRKLNEQIDNFVDVFRSKWKGLKVGAMGDRTAVKSKLKRWIQANKGIELDVILKAVDLYINTEGRDPRFLQRADYFIYKQDTKKNEASRLSAYVDEILQGANTDDDWTSKLS